MSASALRDLELPRRCGREVVRVQAVEVLEGVVRDLKARPRSALLGHFTAGFRRSTVGLNPKVA